MSLAIKEKNCINGGNIFEKKGKEKFCLWLGTDVYPQKIGKATLALNNYNSKL